jgi:hypothetical protein
MTGAGVADFRVVEREELGPEREELGPVLDLEEGVNRGVTVVLTDLVLAFGLRGVSSKKSSNSSKLVTLRKARRADSFLA